MQVASKLYIYKVDTKIILICSVLAYVTIATNDLAKTFTNFFTNVKKLCVYSQ